MIALDPSDSLQHYPLSMTKFGLNPFGENRFRVVLAHTRRSLVCGSWNGAGALRAKYCLTYPQIALRKDADGTVVPQWILEEWLDAFSFTGVTAEQWGSDSQLNILGPYPHRGEYVMIGNDAFNPADTNIEKLITLVHASDRYTWAEKLTACRNQATKEEIERSCLRDAIIRDAFPAFGHAPFSQLSTGRGGAAKTSPVLRSANELGLPVPQGVPGQATTGGGMIIPKKKRRAA